MFLLLPRTVLDDWLLVLLGKRRGRKGKRNAHCTLVCYLSSGSDSLLIHLFLFPPSNMPSLL